MNINYRIKTEKNFHEAVDALKRALGNHKFGVLWELNFKDKLKEKGFDFERNFIILEACNPARAKEALEENIEVGYFLPCRMVVFEDKNSVFMGLLKPTEIIGLLNSKELTGIAQEVEKELMDAIEEAK